MKLIIVESPAKCGKIESFLGSGYKCLASFGHIREIANGLKSIDVNNNYQVTFKPTRSKSQNISNLRKRIKKAEEVILATDEDREGEAIAWHICKLFNLPITTTKRIIFHEITKSALKNAVQNPTIVNMNTVNAQLARQVLDLMVGYKISPILWKNISRGSKLSAGRCQIPALRLVYDQQKLIDEHPGKKVYNTVGNFLDKHLDFTLNKHHNTEDSMVSFLEDSADFTHKYNVTEPRRVTKNPPEPFTTSTLQQKASNHFGYSPKQTMRTAQNLYEGGYITYMRTDSKIYSKEFIEKASIFIVKKYGSDYEDYPEPLLHPLIKVWNDTDNKKSKKSSKKINKKEKEGPPPQEAHEAIRPTNINIEKLPEDSDFTSREVRLYRMIWRNTVESCMVDAIYKSFAAKITAPEKYEYKYLTEQIMFPGWKLVNGYEETNPIYSYLQTIKKGIINYKKIVCKLTMKDLKSHYTEAKLVQLLEQKGIGRPSTFSSLVEKIQERGYIKKENIKGKIIICTDYELEDDEITEIENQREFGNEKNKLVIQSIGVIVLEFLLKTYRNLFEYEYTKNMEDILDLIAKGEKEYHELCAECLSEIEQSSKTLTRDNKEDIIIDENHIYMIGKHGPVIKYVNVDNPKDTKFISVKKDIDLDKLRNGEYTIKEIIEDSNLNKKLGYYKDNELFLKKGQFGIYIVWGENKKSINNIQIKESDITLDDIIPYIENTTNPNMVREITPELSIRNGKYGDYIFYKTNKMTKPKFYKLNEFKENYKSCDIDVLKEWINETYKICKS